MEIIKYPDGFSYTKAFGDSKDRVIKLNSYNDLWYLHQYIDACKSIKVKPNIIIPCLPDAQADRRFNKNESSGLKLVCKFLNKMKANFKIFHPHNQEVVEALMDDVEIIDNSEFIEQVLYNLHLSKIDNPVVLLPDGGAFKWGAKLMDKLDFTGDVIAAAKNRKFVVNDSILTQQLPDYDFKCKDVLIIDDICIGGGTFKGLSKLLKERNCGKLYLAVSHITVENLGEDPVTNYFDQVFTTNSKYNNYFVRDGEAGGKQPENLTVIKMF